MLGDNRHLVPPRACSPNIEKDGITLQSKQSSEVEHTSPKALPSNDLTKEELPRSDANVFPPTRRIFFNCKLLNASP